VPNAKDKEVTSATYQWHSSRLWMLRGTPRSSWSSRPLGFAA